MQWTLKMARAKVDMTQEQMAEKLEISRNTYIDYEDYKTPMRIDKALKFCEIVGLSIDDIIFFKEKLHFKCIRNTRRGEVERREG